MRRAIRLNGIDKELELERVSQINHLKNDYEFFNLEKMPNGKWRLTYTLDTISDIRDLQSLEIIRED